MRTVSTDLRGREWTRPSTVARNLRYAFVQARGGVAGTQYGRIVMFLSRRPALMAKVTAYLARGTI